MNHNFAAILFLVFLLRLNGAFADDNSIQIITLRKAEMFFSKSEFDSSLKYLNLANVYAKRIGNDSLKVVTSIRSARIFLLIEQNDSAITILKSSRDFIENRFWDQNELMAQCNDLIGDYYMALSDADVALLYYKKSLNIRNNLYSNNHPRVAFSLSNLARYYNFKIEKDSAFHYSEKAYKIFESFSEQNFDIPYERIFTEYAYAYKIYYLNRRMDKSRVLEEVRDLLNKALLLTKMKYGSNSWVDASIFRNIGNTYTDLIYLIQGNAKLKLRYYMQAMNFYDKSIFLTTTHIGSRSSSLSILYFVKGVLCEYTFNKDSAEKILKYYDKSIQCLIPAYKSDNLIGEMELKKCDSKYELMTTIIMKSHYNHHLYNDTGQEIYLKSSYQCSKNMIPLWNYMIEEFESQYTNRLIGIYNQNIFNLLVELAWKLYEIEHDIKYLNDIFYYSEQSKGSLQNRLLVDAVSHADKPRNPLIVTPSDIQKALPNHETVFIEFFDTTMVIGISKDQFLVRKLNEKINQDSLLKVYQSMLHINSPKDYQTTAHLIYQTFFEPILSSIGKDIKYLIIANDGMISKVAVSGLVSDTTGKDNDFRYLKYVAHKYSIRHVLSGNDLLRNIQKEYSESGTLIGFAPNFESKSSLPFSKSLVQNLQEQMRGDYYLDKEGSKQNFLNNAPKYQVIQLSTHAEADLGEMMKSKIYFSDVDTQSNFITLDSIYKMKFQTQLAVLSACETNVGRLEYGEGSMNFSRAFLYAGCKSTLTTQWKVDDKTTSGILLNFYNHALDNNTLSESLQKAQLAYLNNCNSSAEANPFFWSSLVITGSDMPVYLDKKSNSLTYGLIGISALMIFTGLYRIKKKREQVSKV